MDGTGRTDSDGLLRSDEPGLVDGFGRLGQTDGWTRTDGRGRTRADTDGRNRADVGGHGRTIFGEKYYF